MGGKPIKHTKGKLIISDSNVLDLSKTIVTFSLIPEELRRKEFSNLVELKLSDNNLCYWDKRNHTSFFKKIVLSLDGLQKLKKLYLSSNEIQDEGCELVSEFLTRNQSIEFINLMYNGITVAGAKSLALALSKNSTLKSLILDSNMVSFSFLFVQQFLSFFEIILTQHDINNLYFIFL